MHPSQLNVEQYSLLPYHGLLCGGFPSVPDVSVHGSLEEYCKNGLYGQEEKSIGGMKDSYSNMKLDNRSLYIITASKEQYNPKEKSHLHTFFLLSFLSAPLPSTPPAEGWCNLSQQWHS